MGDPTRFQISAPIQPGNSGGPIVNDNFEVIGVANEKISDEYVVGKTGQVPQNVNFGVKVVYAVALFDEDIENSINAKLPKIESLEDVVESTVFIRANRGGLPESSGATPSSQIKTKKNTQILITYSYRYYWDVFHWTLTSFQIRWIDGDSGEVIATGNHSGDGFLSHVGIVQNVMKQIFSKAGM